MVIISNFASERIKIINIICAIMVVGIHCEATRGLDNDDISYKIQEFLCGGIYRGAVPIFFLIASILLLRNTLNPFDKYYKKVKSRVKTLLVPYLAYSVLIIIVNFLIQTLIDFNPALRSIINNFPQSHLPEDVLSFIRTVTLSPIAGQLWFLRDLFFLVILSPAILFLIRKLRVLLLGFIGLCWFLNFEILPNLGGSHFLKIESLFFFSLGTYLVCRKINLDELLKLVDKRVGFSFFVIWLSLNFFRVIVDPNFDIWNSNQYSISGLILHKLSILFGIMSVVWLAGNVRGKYLSEITQFSFFLYLFHSPLCWYVGKFMQLLGTPLPILFLLSHISTTCLTLIIAYHWKCLHPRTYFIISGGRL